MKKFIWTLTIINIFVFCECQMNKQENFNKNDEKVNETVFIFHHYPEMGREIKIKTGGSMLAQRPDIMVYARGNANVIHPKNDAIDTITFQVDKNGVTLRHRYHIISELVYRFQPDDTISFTYSDSTITAKVHNRPTKKYDVNYDMELRRELYKGQYFIPIDKYNNAAAFLIPSNRNFSDQLADIKKNNLDWIIEFSGYENHYLDSLLDAELISHDIWHFYKERNNFQVQSILLRENQLEKTKIEDMLVDYNDSLYRQRIFYYNDFMQQLVSKVFIENTMSIDLGNTFVRDYKNAFDNVQNSQIVKGQLREDILKNLIHKIAGYFPIQDIDLYLQKFSAEIQDSIFVNSIKRKFLIGITSLSKEKGDTLFLINSDQQISTFHDLLKSLNGKLIYVDFWASWCAPCREEMPFSKQLRDKYKEKNIAFVYISIDKNFDDWHRASQKEEIADYAWSYMVINKESGYLKEVGINEIPRYLLYDQSCNLIIKDAPSPKGNQIIKLLDDYLADQ